MNLLIGDRKMKHMTELMNKIDPVVADATKEKVSQLIYELDNIRDVTIFRAKLRQQGKLTPELEEVFDKGV